MDKKKKIIIGSVVGVILLGVAILFSVGSKDDSVVTNKGDVVQEDNSGSSQGNENDSDENTESSSEDTQNENNDEPVISSDEDIDQNDYPIEEPNGVDESDFEKGLKELEYSLFTDNIYDYFSGDKSIVLVEIGEEVIKFFINDKSDINNEKIKSAIKLLIPNEIDNLYKRLNNNEHDIAISIDNRTVSVISNDEGIILEITQ